MPEKVDQIADMIHAFDAEPRQVLIEAKIVEVGLNDDFIFGIDWQMVLQSSIRDEREVDIDMRALGGISSPSDSPVTSPLSSLTVDSEPGLGTLSVNRLGGFDDFNAIVSVLEGISKVKIISFIAVQLRRRIYLKR